ncbi:MAG: hypothetical protein JWO51_4915 [Rhodospirillales bacterium]|nr:hypothetical protein [Rhodospirillales bacterium]
MVGDETQGRKGRWIGRTMLVGSDEAAVPGGFETGGQLA